MIPTGPLTSHVPTGSQPSQSQAGSLAGVGPATHPLEPATGPETTPEVLFSVAKGEPTPEELAALTAVVLSLGQSQQAAPESPGVRHWVRRQQLRLAPRPGPEAWRRSLG
ncbi:hypothetical protein M2428_002396 [Arthrobacter sp. ES3-54]|nr:hypothetical protein [Arthrobacter sp. ES3-54]